MKKILYPLCFALTIISCAPKGEMATSGNPIDTGWYADPEVAVYGNKYWIFPTYSARFENQVFFDAFSSSDLVNWEKHSRILDTGSVKWVKEALWAPSTIEKDGKYYLFFAANDIQNPYGPYWNPEIDTVGEIGGIGVAVADKPEGPYTDYLGKPLINEFYNNAQPIDQFVFKYTDGNYYIVYGGWRRCNIGRLNNNFTALQPFDDGDIVKEITPEKYVEGPIMFMRAGKLYFMWSEGNWGDSTYNVAYAIADTPFGPFNRIGAILESDPEIATGAGHHSVLNIPGTDDWYIVYHRRPIPNFDRDHRVTCIDRMYFNEDGTIQPVKITVEGVGERQLSN
ncbi:MAG: glycoside hydrolase family 43 protein [Bacteroidales bacterium]|nr:glycoside hydrolase family 43 protein [Bacteroidales bacterium]